MKELGKFILYALYVASPIDLLPEGLLGPYGLADDVVAALLGLQSLFRAISAKEFCKFLFFALYVVSPVDLLPESILGPLGLPDDVVAGLMGLRSLYRSFANNSND